MIDCDLCGLESNAFDFSRVCCAVRWWKRERSMWSKSRANAVLKTILRQSKDEFVEQVRKEITR